MILYLIGLTSITVSTALQTATTTRYWDCSGGSCGCAYLPAHLGGDNWKPAHCYSNSMFSAPEGNPYGAKFYGTAAISQALGGGDWLAKGCGKCWKVTGTSNIANWDTTTTTTLVLKGTNYCPPGNPMCSGGNAHFDIAAPGFDYIETSLSNTCDERETIEKEAFKSCTYWMIASQDPIQHCNCDLFSSSVLREGCNNFKSLNWDNPTVTYEEVICPIELGQLPCWEENGNGYPSLGNTPDLCMDPLPSDVAPSSPTLAAKPTSSPAAITVSTASPSSSNTRSGKATYYGGNEQGGACGYKDLPKISFPFGLAVAAGSNTFNNGYGCGACYEITCKGPYGDNPSCMCDPSTSSVIVQVTDQCPECTDTHFDLNPLAMETIVGDGLAGTCGVIETTVKRVDCDFQSNIKIRSKAGTNPWWYGLHVDDVAGHGAVSKVELRTKDSMSFDVSCDKEGGPSYWLCHFSTPLEFPLGVRLTDSAGRQLTADNVITTSAGNTEFDFGSNFGSIDNINHPTKAPSMTYPTRSPTNVPAVRTKVPTTFPTKPQTKNPTTAPTLRTTKSPTTTPVDFPKESPSKPHTKNPTKAPTHPEKNPTNATTLRPTTTPTKSLTTLPTASITLPTICGVDTDQCTSNINSCCIDYECVGGQYYRSCQLKQDATCLPRWDECTNNIHGCCEGLVCLGGHYYRQCRKP